jgi:hypothetical protein
MELKNGISRDMLFLQHNKGGTALTRPLHPYGCEGLLYFLKERKKTNEGISKNL